MSLVPTFVGAEMLYLRLGDDAGTAARAQLALRDWRNRLADTDARSGLSLPQGWTELCRRSAAQPDPQAAPLDQLGAIIVHVDAALRHLLVEPRQRIVRAHAIMPLHTAREFDSTSIAWLSRQNGRTVREKLAGRAGVMAVRRESTPDTLENRLLRLFCLRLERLLVLRCAALPAADEADLLARLQHWLRQETTIGDWNHQPPNNVLLQDRHYRKVWDGWMRLQRLDRQVDSDRLHLAANWLEALRWKLLGRLHLSGLVRFAEQPCYLDSDSFAVQLEQGATVSGLLMEQRLQGKLIKLGEGADGGYGFILHDGEKRYFHHKAMREPGSYATLKVGARATFALGPTGKVLAVAALDDGVAGARSVRVAPVEGVEFSIALDGRTLALRILQPAAGRPVLLLDGQKLPLPEYTLALADQMVAQLLRRLKLNPALPAGAAVPPEPGAPAVVDLAELRPAYASGAGAGMLPFRLMRQLWDTAQEGTVALDLGDASAVSLHPGADVLTMADLVQGRAGGPAGCSEQAALAFAARLADFFGDVPLTYLTPDAIDDFALGTARRALNAHFGSADPLPRSVAALFDWMGAREPPRVAHGDYVLVLDNIGGAVTLTPLRARHEPALAASPPAQQLSWDKLAVVDLSSQASLEQLARRALAQQGVAAAEEIGGWMGGQAALPGAGDLSWQGESFGWHTCTLPLDAAAPEALTGLARGVRDAAQRLDRKRCVGVLLACGAHPLLTALSAQLGRDKWPVWRTVSLVGGAQRLRQWQVLAGALPLWRESLPALSIRVPADGRYRHFHLVRGGSVEPRRGVPQEIQVDETFTLPAGQDTVLLPLRQGAADASGKVLSYQLRIRSPAFPLREDVPARLRLTFSYGSNDPYALSFVARDPARAGFTAVRAEWALADPQALATHVPPLPAARNWAQLEQDMPHKDLGLLDRVLTKIYQDVETLRGQGFPSAGARRLVRSMRKDLRNLMLDIWSDGRSFLDADCPPAFEHAMRSCLPVLAPLNDEIWVLAIVRPDLQDLAAEFMFMMCALRGDMPGAAWDTIRLQIAASLAERSMLSHARWALACLLGQGEAAAPLLNELLRLLADGDAPCKPVVLELLGMAMWRSPQLVHALTAAQVKQLAGTLETRLASACSKIRRSGGVSRDLGTELVQCLEVLLALLRTRAAPQPAVARQLAVGSAAVSRLASLLEQVEELVCQPDVKLHPRIRFSSGRPDSLHATPDLLYLANLYLLGESGVGQIRVTGMAEQDED